MLLTKNVHGNPLFCKSSSTDVSLPFLLLSVLQNGYCIDTSMLIDPGSK